MDRYVEIIRSEFAKKKITLSSKEKEDLQLLKKEIEKYKIEQQKKILRLCINEKLDADKYQAMLKAYQSDILFQRSLSTYFQTQINQQR